MNHYTHRSFSHIDAELIISHFVFMHLISPSAVQHFALIISELHLVDLRPSLQFIILRYDPACQTKQVL